MIGVKQKITDYLTSITKTYFPAINLKASFFFQYFLRFSFGALRWYITIPQPVSCICMQHPVLPVISPAQPLMALYCPNISFNITFLELNFCDRLPVTCRWPKRWAPWAIVGSNTSPRSGLEKAAHDRALCNNLVNAKIQGFTPECAWSV